MPYCAYCGTQVVTLSYAPCPSCGSPTNGAPRGTGAPRSNAALIVGIVVVVALVAVAIVGILAAIAIPNLLTAMQRSKQKRTLADMRSIATALEAYSTDTNRYPSADELRQELAPKYIPAVPSVDGWGHPLRYECWNSQGEGVCDAYVIGSAGKDGKFEHEALTDYEEGATTNFDAGIIFSN